MEVRVRVDSFPRCSGAILEHTFLYSSGARRPQRHGYCISMTSNHACALNLAPNPPVISFACSNTNGSNQHVRSKMQELQQHGASATLTFLPLTLISEDSSPDRFQPPFPQLASCKPVIAAELQPRPVRFALILITWLRLCVLGGCS